MQAQGSAQKEPKGSADPKDVLSGSKILSDMRNNPRGGWTKDDIETASRQAGLICKNGKRGSHFKVRSEVVGEIQTIPSARPIKPIYIKKFVELAERHLRSSAEKDAKR